MFVKQSLTRLITVKDADREGLLSKGHIFILAHLSQKNSLDFQYIERPVQQTKHETAGVDCRLHYYISG